MPYAKPANINLHFCIRDFHTKTDAAPVKGPARVAQW